MSDFLKKKVEATLALTAEDISNAIPQLESVPDDFLQRHVIAKAKAYDNLPLAYTSSILTHHLQHQATLATRDHYQD